jgi:hypothetical protein
MATPVLAAALVLYFASAAAYVAAFVQPARVLVARSGLALTAAGLLVQTVAIGLGCAETQGRHPWPLPVWWATTGDDERG